MKSIFNSVLVLYECCVLVPFFHVADLHAPLANVTYVLCMTSYSLKADCGNSWQTIVKICLVLIKCENVVNS